MKGDWSIDNYRQMNILRGIYLLSALCIVSIVGYSILFEVKSDFSKYVILIPLIPAVFTTLTIRPEFVKIGIVNDQFYLHKRDLVHPKKNLRIQIPVEKLKNTRMKRQNTLYRGRLVINYEKDDMLHETSISMNSFNLSQREKIVKNLSFFP